MTDPYTPGTTVYALNLAYSETAVVVATRSQGFRIRLVASVKSGFPDAAIFRFQAVSANEILFTGVCSPADLVDYGLTIPQLGDYFRSDTMDLVWACQSEALEFRDECLENIQTLCDEMSRINNTMSTPQTIVVTS